MHRYRESLKGISLLSASEAVNQTCSFVRNVILARFLTKADFGVAALLAMVLMLLDTTSKMALGQQIVQSKHGDNPAFVDAVQFTQVAAGIIGAALILAAAWPAAHYFSAPRYLPSIMALALIPLCNGLGNIDLYRRARQLGFERLILADSLPQIAATAAAWPVASIFPDYRAVLYLLLGRAILASALSQLLAERPFHPRCQGIWLRDSLRFGWPLLLSGFVQFGNFQGESMVVAAGYTLSQLGEYSVATTMAMTPAFAFTRVSTSLSLPLLAEVQGDPGRLTRRYACYVEAVALIACAATLGMVFVGEYFVVLFFGAKYTGVGTLASWLIAGQALRVIRAATVSAAMARGDTMNMMVCSFWRLGALPLSIAAGLLHGSMIWFAVTGFVGEIAALAAAVHRLARRQGVAPGTTLGPTAAAAACALAGVAARAALGVPAHSALNGPLLAAALALSLAVFFGLFPNMRSLVANGISRLRMPEPGVKSVAPRT